MMGVAGSGTRSVHRHIAGAHRAVGILWQTATTLGSTRRKKSFGILPKCRATMRISTTLVHHHVTEEQFATGFLQYSAMELVNSGSGDSYNILHNLCGAVGIGTSSIHRHTAWDL